VAVEIAAVLVFFAVKGEFGIDPGGAAIAAILGALVLAPYVLVGAAVALALLLRSARGSAGAPSRPLAVVHGVAASTPLAVVLLLWLGPVALVWTLSGGQFYGLVLRLPQRS
jgi:hypothetical protein